MAAGRQQVAATTTVGTGPVDNADQLRDGLEKLIADPKGSCVMIAIGQKGSGKSFTCLKLLRHALENGYVDKAFLIAPTARFEAADSYAWCDPKRVYIITTYSPALIFQLLHRRDNGEDCSRVALFIDDMAAGDGQTLGQDQNFAALMAIARHVRLGLLLMAHHSCTGAHVLSPIIRQLATHCLLTRISSRKLVESVYDEWVSLSPAWSNFREFAAWFTQITREGPGSGVILDVGGKTPDTLSWSFKNWWKECAPDVPPRQPHAAAKPAPKPRARSDSSSSDDDRRPARRPVPAGPSAPTGGGVGGAVGRLAAGLARAVM